MYTLYNKDGKKLWMFEPSFICCTFTCVKLNSPFKHSLLYTLVHSKHVLNNMGMFQYCVLHEATNLILTISKLTCRDRGHVISIQLIVAIATSRYIQIISLYQLFYICKDFPIITISIKISYKLLDFIWNLYNVW